MRNQLDGNVKCWFLSKIANTLITFHAHTLCTAIWLFVINHLMYPDYLHNVYCVKGYVFCSFWFAESEKRKIFQRHYSAAIIAQQYRDMGPRVKQCNHRQWSEWLAHSADVKARTILWSTYWVPTTPFHCVNLVGHRSYNHNHFVGHISDLGDLC